jgi:hypothetical protein
VPSTAQVVRFIVALLSFRRGPHPGRPGYVLPDAQVTLTIQRHASRPGPLGPKVVLLRGQSPGVTDDRRAGEAADRQA